MKVHIGAPGAGAERGTEQFKIGSVGLQVDASGAVSFKCGEARVFLAGEFFYSRKDKVEALDRRGAVDQLQRVMSAVGPEGFPGAVEGTYFGLWVDERAGKAVMFNDPLNRRNVFYTDANGTKVFSDRIADVANAAASREPNQLGMYSYLLLGYTPLDETMYKNVRRLGADEFVVVTDKGAKFERHTRPKDIAEYGRPDLDRYDTIITNSVLSRSSSSENVVMNSGGWDSTALVYLLTKHLGKDKVNSIVFDVHLSDGTSFNIYEVDKVQRISKYFGIKTDTCVIDYSKKECIDAWEKSAPLLRENNVFFWIHHCMMANQIGAKAGKDASVFSGEASDSIHNFGYSQFVSVNYPNMFLREYADKGKSYLYGPTFLQEIDSGKYTEDKVYQFFTWYYGDKRFEDVSGASASQRRQKYLESFVFSYPRLPFAKWHNEDVAQSGLVKEFTSHVEKNYFEPTAGSMSSKNLYFHLLQMYRAWHFQSAQIAVSQAALSKFNLSCQMPFLDIQMLEYMYSMPEDWGRGLEIRTTKYPLRYLANERWQMPIHILEEPGPHSYIAENDKKWTYAGGSWDIYCEILYNSVFSGYFRDKLAAFKLEDYFDGSLFNLTYMKKVVQDYVAGKQDLPSHGLIFKLCLLDSIGLYR